MAESAPRIGPVARGAYHRPPIGRRGYLWRILVAALLSFAGFLLILNEPAPRIGLDLLGGVLSWIAIFWRRRWPTAIALITAVLGAFSGLAIGPALWALFSIATTRQWSRYALVVTVSLVASVAYAPLDPANTLDDFRIIDGHGQLVPDWQITVIGIAATLLVVIGAAALVAAWGGQIGARRELLWTLRDRAERAEHERDLKVDQARRMERERIAREMHDGLAHRISQISMHAGALAYREDPSASELRQSMEIIQQASHQAMIELRDVLGVLRNTDPVGNEPAGPSRPLPTASEVPVLIDFNRSAGMTVIDRLDDAVLSAVPDQIGRAVYRVVQEGLTNAARHAPGAPVTITVGGDDSHIAVEVTNPLGGHGTEPRAVRPSLPESGYGLIGLQERIALLDGTMRAERVFDRFRLRVRIPYASPADTVTR